MLADGMICADSTMYTPFCNVENEVYTCYSGGTLHNGRCEVCFKNETPIDFVFVPGPSSKTGY